MVTGNAQRPHEGMTTEEIHQLGAQRFAWDWISANQVMIDAAGRVGVDHSTRSTRLLLSACAFALCETLEEARARAAATTEQP